ncbi:protogenin B-like [Patella vulgata]|uniref:protogenin B-like n=1 Tax=Patella vulgata TaxID=6465 RepID=UPI0024A82867|nr:protogenin B-like [Patella vulgata]
MLAGTEKGFPDFTDGEWPWIYHKVPETSYRNSIFPTVNITVINSTTVHFSWRYHGPIELSEQIIFLRNLIQMKVENVINYQPTSRQITLSDLAQNTFHEFILVVKSKSLATGSISKLFHTSTSMLSQPTYTTRPDINIIASLLAPDQITLTWSYPETNQDIILFRVRCETIFVPNECERKNISYVKSHTNTAVISNLLPFTWYNISVKAERSDGQGVYSIPTLVLTREGLPSPPEHVQARVVSPDEVALEWSRPAQPNGNIKGHYISYSYDHYDPDKWPQIYQEGKMNSTHISNLTQPMYYFLIRACTLAGQGKPSRIIKVFMKHDSRGSLSDQHLGIIGGASIGITCILITVCVIYIKQRQLKKRCIAAQVANSVPCPHGCMIPPALTPAEHLSQHQNHVCKSEELWSLLTPSDKSTIDSPCSSNDTQSTSTATTDLYCHVTSC